MRNLTHITVALALVGFTVPALAGSWPNLASSRGKLLAAPKVTIEKAADGAVYSGSEEGGSSLGAAFRNEEKEIPAFKRRVTVAGTTTAPAAAKGAVGNFVYRGEATGWEMTQHAYTWKGGRFAMSDDCDHAVRLVQGPTRDEVDATKKASPGA